MTNSSASQLSHPDRPYILKCKPQGGRIETVSFDEEYLRRLADRDPFVEQHFGTYFGELLYIKLRGKVRSPQLIEDVRQETLMRVLRAVRRNGIDHPERLGAYVVAVCNRVMLEAFRSETRYREMNEESSLVPDPHCSADETFVTGERKEQVRAILRELNEKDRELLKLIFLEERDKDEVCLRFGVERGYLRVLLHRARLRFKEVYRKRHES